MDQLVSRLLLYGNLGQDSILMKLSKLFQDWKGNNCPRQVLIRGIYDQVKALLDLATDYGFDENLWQNYLTFLLITDENPFSLTCEKVGANDGSVNAFAKSDFAAFMELFHFDFSRIEAELGIDVFSRITNYRSIVKKELMYNKNVSEKVRALSEKLAQAKDETEFFQCVTGFYHDYGVGMFGLNKAFRLAGTGDSLRFQAINNMDTVMLDDLVGYEIQKKQLVENTEAFVSGRKANNEIGRAHV